MFWTWTYPGVVFRVLEVEPAVVEVEVPFWGLEPVVVGVFFSGVLLWSMVIWLETKRIFEGRCYSMIVMDVENSSGRMMTPGKNARFMRLGSVHPTWHEPLFYNYCSGVKQECSLAGESSYTTVVKRAGSVPSTTNWAQVRINDMVCELRT